MILLCQHVDLVKSKTLYLLKMVEGDAAVKMDYDMLTNMLTNNHTVNHVKISVDL